MFRHHNLASKIKNIFKTNASNLTRVISTFVLGFLIFGNPVLANLNSDISNYENLKSESYRQQNSLTAELNQLDTQISAINAELYNTQSQLDTKNAEIKTVELQISEAIDNIAKNKLILGEYFKQMYMDGQTSQVELILTSNNFSDFVDKSEYMSTMQNKVQETMEKIAALKKSLEEDKIKLETDKAKIEQLKFVQQTQRQNVAAQIENKNNLINQTKGDQSRYQNILDDLYAARRRQSEANGEVSGGSGSGGYPYTGSCGGVDPWGFYKCQCTSYASWYWNKQLGLPLELYTVGNAGDWVTLAYDNGYSVSSTPQIGSVAIWPIGSLSRPASAYDNGYYDIYGHVAIVTGINGGTISVSEYNFHNPEAYGTRSNVQISFTNGYGTPYNLSFINY